MPTLFLRNENSPLALTGQDVDVMQHLLRPLGFSLQSRTLEAMVGCDDLIVFFLDEVHLHPSGQSEMNTSRLTLCSKCDKGALLLCFFNLGNLEMIE